MKNIIQLEDISFEYQDTKSVLNNISLNINEGEYISVLGKNGSGKSTLALLLCGINSKFKGKYLLNGVEIKENTFDIVNQNVGIVFQNPENQFIANSVEEDIAFGLENKNISREEMKKIVHEFSKKVGMDECLSKEPSMLSGGQKQRVAIAAMLALKTKVLILDESTSMLDVKAKKDVLDLIKNIRKENPNLTIISITHDINDVLNADKVLVLEKGKNCFFDSPEKLLGDENLMNKFGFKKPFVTELKLSLKKEGILIKNNDLDLIAEEIYDQIK